MIAALLAWLALAVLGVPVLYIGYGFVMCAKRAKEDGLSQSFVVKVDTAIALIFVLLDALLNLVVFSVAMVDFRLHNMFKRTMIRGVNCWVPVLVTERLSNYSQNLEESGFRRATADIFAAFLDAKDPSGDHIKGTNTRFTWMDW